MTDRIFVNLKAFASAFEESFTVTQTFLHDASESLENCEDMKLTLSCL